MHHTTHHLHAIDLHHSPMLLGIEPLGGGWLSRIAHHPVVARCGGEQQGYFPPITPLAGALGRGYIENT